VGRASKPGVPPLMEAQVCDLDVRAFSVCESLLLLLRKGRDPYSRSWRCCAGFKDARAQFGPHRGVAEAETCIVSTYLLVADIVRIADDSSALRVSETPNKPNRA
jgi:hypothetical protein